jgi:methylmalonyl-CoA/ethylmalonyl-CoA epimerase
LIVIPKFPYFDHFAIGVKAWEDSFPRFVSRAGGRWTHGNDAGEFAPYQLEFEGGMRLEFIAPGSVKDGFMERFIATRGPGPHHLTFKVNSIQASLLKLQRIGIKALGEVSGHPMWREVFIHPKAAGTGTLLQLVEADEIAMEALNGYPAPDGFPTSAPPNLNIAWVGLTVHSVSVAREIFVEILEGTVVDEGSSWIQISWGPGRVLVVREPDAYPGSPDIWTHALGVTNITFGPDLIPLSTFATRDIQWERWPDDPLTCVDIWEFAFSEQN